MLGYLSVYSHTRIYQTFFSDRPTKLPSELGTLSQVLYFIPRVCLCYVFMCKKILY